MTQAKLIFKLEAPVNSPRVINHSFPPSTPQELATMTLKSLPKGGTSRRPLVKKLTDEPAGGALVGESTDVNKLD